MQTIENRIAKVERKAKTTSDKEAKMEMELLAKLKPCLEEGKPVRSLELTEDEQALMKMYNLLTAKPVIYVCNLDEEGAMDPESNAYYQKVKEYAAQENSEVVSLCAKMEEELSGLEPDERAAFLEELGISTSGLDTLIQKAYHF